MGGGDCCREQQEVRSPPLSRFSLRKTTAHPAAPSTLYTLCYNRGTSPLTREKTRVWGGGAAAQRVGEDADSGQHQPTGGIPATPKLPYHLFPSPKGTLSFSLGLLTGQG